MDFLRFGSHALIGSREPKEDAVKIRRQLMEFCERTFGLGPKNSMVEIEHITRGIKFLDHVITRRVIYLTLRHTASGVRTEREQRAGDATRRGSPVGGYAGVPAVFQQHTCVSRGGSAREQENPEVHGGVGIATQSGSFVSSQGSTTSNSSYSSPIVQTRPPHLEETPGPPSSLLDPYMPEHHRHGKANRHHHRLP
jgi:hypothetical protein